MKYTYLLNYKLYDEVFVTKLLHVLNYILKYLLWVYFI